MLLFPTWCCSGLVAELACERLQTCINMCSSFPCCHNVDTLNGRHRTRLEGLHRGTNVWQSSIGTDETAADIPARILAATENQTPVRGQWPSCQTTKKAHVQTLGIEDPWNLRQLCPVIRNLCWTWQKRTRANMRDSDPVAKIDHKKGSQKKHI